VIAIQPLKEKAEKNSRVYMSSEPFINSRQKVNSSSADVFTQRYFETADAGGTHFRRRKAPVARDIQMFLHGGESTIVTENGDYNIHRLVPVYIKYYLNWTRDTFPSIVRLGWISLMTLFISIKLVTIFMFAATIDILDVDHVCVANAITLSDYFYFVVQTIFTIGYGNMYPTCHMTNMMVTIISFLGMFQMATFTGIFFAKFSMDPRRNYACAFSTQIVGIPPSPATRTNNPQSSEMVKFNFRFVNVFHRRYFNVSCRLFLIEHRLNPVTEKWLTPYVEELVFFDTSAPLDFMSLPIEVCAYVPFSRLMKHSGTSSPSPSPGLGPVDMGVKLPRFSPENGRAEHRWVRHYSPEFRQTCVAIGQDTGSSLLESIAVSDDNPEVTPEFEMMCMLVFTDATTGSEIAVRKSWPLSEVLWLSPYEPAVEWKDIIHRDEKAASYYVDVTGLDEIVNRRDAVIDYASLAASPVGAATPAAGDMTYSLINTMTLTTRGSLARGQVHQHANLNEIFSAIPEEPLEPQPRHSQV